MDEAIRKAKVLIEALGWIQRFRGKFVVVKIGGSTLDDVIAVESAHGRAFYGDCRHETCHRSWRWQGDQCCHE